MKPTRRWVAPASTVHTRPQKSQYVQPVPPQFVSLADGKGHILEVFQEYGWVVWTK